MYGEISHPPPLPFSGCYPSCTRDLMQFPICVTMTLVWSHRHNKVTRELMAWLIWKSLVFIYYGFLGQIVPGYVAQLVRMTLSTPASISSHLADIIFCTKKSHTDIGVPYLQMLKYDRARPGGYSDTAWLNIGQTVSRLWTLRSVPNV